MLHVAKTHRQGFTLIELLVVITIIAILAAILFPVFVSAKQAAKNSQCQSNMRQVATAMLRYADDYNGMTPSPCFYFTKWGDGRGWTERVAAYIHGRTKTAPTKGDARVYVCPSQRFNYSYGVVWTYVGKREEDKGFMTSLVLRPSKMIMIYHLRPYYKGDENDPGAWASMMDDSGLSNDHQKDGLVYYRHSVHGTSKGMRAYYLAWPGVHNEGNNLAFVDGHVGWYSDWSAGRMTFLPNPNYRSE